MTWLFFYAMVVLVIVSTSFLVGVICYHVGMWNERKAWNKHLGLPERDFGKPYFTSDDIEKSVPGKEIYIRVRQ